MQWKRHWGVVIDCDVRSAGVLCVTVAGLLRTVIESLWLTVMWDLLVCCVWQLPAYSELSLLIHCSTTDTHHWQPHDSSCVCRHFITFITSSGRYYRHTSMLVVGVGLFVTFVVIHLTLYSFWILRQTSLPTFHRPKLKAKGRNLHTENPSIVVV